MMTGLYLNRNYTGNPQMGGYPAMLLVNGKFPLNKQFQFKQPSEEQLKKLKIQQMLAKIKLSDVLSLSQNVESKMNLYDDIMTMDDIEGLETIPEDREIDEVQILTLTCCIY